MARIQTSTGAMGLISVSCLDIIPQEGLSDSPEPDSLICDQAS
jgi:hypothetical protein